MISPSSFSLYVSPCGLLSTELLINDILYFYYFLTTTISSLQETNRSLIPDMYRKKQAQGWQKTWRPGNPISPQKFLNQDFVELRDHCLSRGILFEDDTFPAHFSSIGPRILSEDKLHQIQWMRPYVSSYQ